MAALPEVKSVVAVSLPLRPYVGGVAAVVELLPGIQDVQGTAVLVKDHLGGGGGAAVAVVHHFQALLAQETLR